jgi:hypothetical protein
VPLRCAAPGAYSSTKTTSNSWSKACGTVMQSKSFCRCRASVRQAVAVTVAMRYSDSMTALRTLVLGRSLCHPPTYLHYGASMPFEKVVDLLADVVVANLQAPTPACPTCAARPAPAAAGGLRRLGLPRLGLSHVHIFLGKQQGKRDAHCLDLIPCTAAYRPYTASARGLSGSLARAPKFGLRLPFRSRRTHRRWQAVVHVLMRTKKSNKSAVV